MKKITIYALGAIFLASCSTSNEVVKNGLFQKRKYNKGWYVNSSKSVKTKKDVSNGSEDVAVTKNNTKPQSQEVLRNHTDEVLVVQNSPEIKDLTTTEETTVKSETNTKSVLATIFTPKKKQAVKKESNIAKAENNVLVDENAFMSNSISQTQPQKVDQISKTNAGGSLSTNKLLLIIIAIFISWLAVGLYTGWETTPTVINLILWLLGGGLYLGVGLFGGTLFVLAFIHAILILLDVL